jgi:hypothetical protein
MLKRYIRTDPKEGAGAIHESPSGSRRNKHLDGRAKIAMRKSCQLALSCQAQFAAIFSNLVNSGVLFST